MEDFRVRVLALAAELRPLRHALTGWARRTPLRPEQVDSLQLASDEAAANVVEHAYGAGRCGMLRLEATCRLDAGLVTVTVTDQGRWRPPTVDPLSTRGRGLQLIHALSDTMQVHTGPAGTSVRMGWTLDREEAIWTSTEPNR